MRERYSLYEFKIIPDNDVWVYEIYWPGRPDMRAIRISDEWFETEQEARFAAIGHIVSLEEGER